MNVGYRVANRECLGFGLARTLHGSSLHIEPVTEATARHYDTVLFSLMSWPDVYWFVKFCHRAGIGWKRGKPRVVVGGYQTFNPAVLHPWAHDIWTGDGDGAIEAVVRGDDSPHYWRGGKSVWRNADISSTPFAWQDPLKPTSTRIEIARGCKHRCKFCQIARLKAYREVPPDVVEAALVTAPTKKVSLFCPERTLHSQWEQIAALPAKHGKTAIDSSVRLRNIKDHRGGCPHVGIEGLSERLRRLVGKPIEDDRIVEAVEWLLSQDRYDFKMYVILGLPTETMDDYAEFKALLTRIGALPFKRTFRLSVSFNAFLPKPFTPWQDEAVDHRINYSHRAQDFFSDLMRRSKQDCGLFINFEWYMHTPYTRLLALIAERGDEDAQRIIFNVATNPAFARGVHVRGASHLALLEKMIGPAAVERYCGAPRIPRPWDGVQLGTMCNAQCCDLGRGALATIAA